MTVNTTAQQNISMSMIVAEKGATAGSSAINISLRGLSVDGISDYQAAGSSIMIDTAGSPNQVAPYEMSEFSGWTHITLTDWPAVNGGLGDMPPNQWATENYFNASVAQVYTSYAFAHDTTNNRLTHYASTGNSGAMQTWDYGYQTYTGLDSATFQVKAVYSTTGTGSYTTMNNPDSQTPASGVWTDITADAGLTYGDERYMWLVADSSQSGVSRITGTVTFYVRALLDGVYYPDTTGYSSGQQDIFLVSSLSDSAGPL